MLMVILGAGASFDSVPAYPPSADFPGALKRPPLADQLFENRPIFREGMRRIPSLQAIVPELQSRHGLPLEQKLQMLAGELKDYPVRYKQMVAVRYYIQYVLWRIEPEWVTDVAGHVTNQRSLLDQIDRWRKGDQPVCLVTFNYDRLIESALAGVGIPIDQLSDYTSSPHFKLFKVHGSIDWVRAVKAPALPASHPNHQWTAATSVIENAEALAIADQIAIAKEYPSGFLGQDYVVPAIAIPLEEKTVFECPADHLSMLEGLIPQTDRLLIIGWRATEQHFLRMLSSCLKGPVSSFIVCANTTEAYETYQRLLDAGIQGEYRLSNAGFSEMITHRELDAFLSDAKAPK